MLNVNDVVNISKLIVKVGPEYNNHINSHKEFFAKEIDIYGVDLVADKLIANHGKDWYEKVKALLDPKLYAILDEDKEYFKAKYNQFLANDPNSTEENAAKYTVSWVNYANQTNFSKKIEQEKIKAKITNPIPSPLGIVQVVPNEDLDNNKLTAKEKDWYDKALKKQQKIIDELKMQVKLWRDDAQSLEHVINELKKEIKTIKGKD